MRCHHCDYPLTNDTAIQMSDMKFYCFTCVDDLLFPEYDCHICNGTGYKTVEYRHPTGTAVITSEPCDHGGTA